MRKPSGSNHGSASRRRRSSGVQLPCSGWVANARAFTRSQASSSRPGRNGRTVTSSGSAGCGIGVHAGQVAPHLQQDAGPGEAVRGGQLGRARQITVRPDRQRAGRELLEPGEQGGAHTLLPVRRVHHQLRGAAVESRVPDQVAVDRGEEVPPAGRPAVLQPQLGLLGQRPNAVGGGGRMQQPEDLGDLVLVEACDVADCQRDLRPVRRR